MSGKPKISENPFERSQPLTSDFFDIPLLGVVRAGMPGTSSGDYDIKDLIINLHSDHPRSVTLEVLDDAMAQAGILRGDFLTVNPDRRPLDGDIIVVKLGERFFIRRFFRQGEFIRLETASPVPATLIVDPETPGFMIIGKVQSLSRQF
jgi:SOS-response transcriptional repressor LexA